MRERWKLAGRRLRIPQLGGEAGFRRIARSGHDAARSCVFEDKPLRRFLARLTLVFEKIDT
jgi:hypothetical protein